MERELRRPVMALLGIMAVFALAAGLLGYCLALNGTVWLPESLSSRVPVSQHLVFMADFWAHSASYLGGFLGGIVLAVITYRRRGEMVTSAA
jgi:membrane associated rhomboid family serine protease